MTKLEDLKKLKVPELKHRLKELGLDTKGLKVELVGRLWSAVDGGLEAKLKSDTTPHPRISTQEETVYGQTQSHRECVDSFTQTELSGPTVTPDSGPELWDHAQQKPQDNYVSTDEDGRAAGDTQQMGKGRAFYEFKEEIKYKRSKLPLVLVTEEPVEEDRSTVKIDSYNSHLHFEVEPDGTSGHPHFWECFPLLWSGCRLTHGVCQNRVSFEVKLVKLLTSQVQNDVELEPFSLRVGWSVASTSLLLGKDYLSFAYDGCGKKVSNGEEDDYGEPLSVGDIVGCYASFSTGGTVELSFHKNGLFLGIAYSLDASALQGQALFPHVLCRSCSIRFRLDPMAGAWYPSPPGFMSLMALPEEEKICAVSSQSKSQCEVIVMVGFPGSGKTHWAKNHRKQHPEKHYRLLSTEELLACMITNVQRDTRLQQASQCLTELIKLAAKRPGNYILDQCNIFFSARHYKLQLFEGFRRKVIVIFPSKEEWKKRISNHELKEGEQIPRTALLKLQVSCTLPEQEDLLEKLQYMELSQQQAQTLLQEYKDEARRQLPPVHKHEEKKRQRFKKRQYPYYQASSQKSRCICQNSWSNLHLWSQQQQFWPTTGLQGYDYTGSY
ncbi:heterogeneous nuclear ribonucleoprotein U-like protein 2 [Eucyclogobius newberryi]|uniref:heterogeneous nuclear ribonucleoprotein U-like protein 2 n=1 Tax=Eucyclogobius newberryi TaxID=166745 RepID=UPI003B5B0D81